MEIENYNAILNIEGKQVQVQYYPDLDILYLKLNNRPALTYQFGKLQPGCPASVNGHTQQKAEDVNFMLESLDSIIQKLPEDFVNYLNPTVYCK